MQLHNECSLQKWASKSLFTIPRSFNVYCRFADSILLVRCIEIPMNFIINLISKMKIWYELIRHFLLLKSYPSQTVIYHWSVHKWGPFIKFHPIHVPRKSLSDVFSKWFMTYIFMIGINELHDKRIKTIAWS